MGFQKILVAIDRSSQASAVFEQAIDLAKKEGAKLMLFQSIHLEATGEVAPILGTGMGLDPSVGRTLQHLNRERLETTIQIVEKDLQTYCQKATDEGIETEFHHKIGEPGVLICELAESWNADLIILGRRGLKGFTEMLLGSVSNYVIHHAKCSILVIQGIHPNHEEPVAS